MAFLGYLLCLAAILPVVGLALFFLVVEQAASVKSWGEFFGLFLKALAFFAEPAKIAGLVVVAALVIVIGAREASRGYGLLAISLTGLLSLFHILRVAGRPDLGQALFLAPSALACAASGLWAWMLLTRPMLK